MLSCFNLAPGVSIDAFQAAVNALDEHLREAGLLASTGRIGRRVKHEVMDTDDERDQQYFFVMSFDDQAQCDRSVKAVFEKREPGDSVHTAVLEKVVDAVFICWEDLDS